ncbi:MAG: hypothetical protein V1899_02150 [Planctomycetota bacterium]
MNCIAQGFRRLAGVSVAALLFFGFAAPSYAELDYEFAKLMLERDEPSFSTEDLIQRLVVKLEANPANKSEAMLIKATVKRRQANAAAAEKADKLLKEVEYIYKEILAGDHKFKHLSVVNSEIKSLRSSRIKAARAAANELRSSDPNKARTVCHDLAVQMETIAAERKVVVDKTEAAFKPLYENFLKWKAKNDPDDEGKPIPSEILGTLSKSFDAWINADNLYVAAKVEQLECYDDSDPDKKPLAAELAKYCETKVGNEALGGFPATVSWYNYILGRIHACTQDAEKASEAWNSALTCDSSNLDETLRKQLFNLKKQIIADLVRMKMKAGKYSDVESIVVEATLDPSLRVLFEEDAGKELQIEYAKALTKQPESGETEYAKAIKKLCELAQQEKSKGASTMWANSFASNMAELFENARAKKFKLRLMVEEWHETARGFYLKGAQAYKKYKELEKDSPNEKVAIKNQFEKMYAEYQNAVGCYQHTISMARSEGADLATRLSVEPKAWVEMGIAYRQMKHYYESIMVCQAFRSAFLPSNRKKWMPDPKSSEGRKFYTKAVNTALEELDKLLGNINNIIMDVVDQNAAAHRHPKDFWNPKLKGMILGESEGEIGLSPGKEIKTLAYIKAKTEMEEAKGLAEAARNDSDHKTQEENYNQAFTKWISAGDKFAKIKSGEDGYEPAIYQAGQAYTLAQALLTTGKLPSKKSADVEKLAKELCVKALDSYQKYLDFVAKTPAVEEEDKAMRTNLEGAVLLARNTLYIGAKEWDKVRKSADDYIAWEQQLSQALTNSSIHVVLQNKFRALIALTGPPNSVPKCDPFLKEAEKVMNELMKIKPKDKILHLYLLTTLSDRNNIAAFQAAKFIREGTLPFGSEDVYENKVAELQEKRVDMVEEEPDQEPALEDYCRLVYLFNKTAKYEKAVMVARKLLGKFDPQQKNVRIPDEAKVWQSLLARMKGDAGTNMHGILKYTDINKDERCKKEHTILIDYLYDTREGHAARTIGERPAFDKYNMDMERALKQIERIYKDFPDCATLPTPDTKKPSPLAIKALNDWIDSWKDTYPDLQAIKPKPGAPKSFLNFIEEEVDFRRKIEATRDLLSSLALEQGEKLAQAGKEDEAKKYREIAGEQIKILGDLRGDTPQMQIKTAEIDISIGKLEVALATLFKIKTTVDRDKDFSIYFDASRKMSEIYARQKKWREAAEFSEYLAITAGFKSRTIKERWPRLKDFLKNCYANGVPCPPQLAADIEADDKSEEKKPDDVKEEPKIEDVKKEATAKEEPKP